MPSKTVRFVEDNESYSPPPTPSPTYSNATLSTSGPITPPPPPTAQLHSTYIYKPFSVASEPKYSISIHPPLATTIHPRFEIDLSTYSTSSQPSGLTSRVLCDGATIPPVNSFTVVCEHLPWTMTITPSSPKLGAIVTVSDVLCGLYLALRHHVKLTELQSEPHHHQQRIHEAYLSRCHRLPPGAREVEMAKGVRRIDFLLGKNRLLGFTLVDNPSATSNSTPLWRFTVSR
jgi:hypothetical protein